MTDEGLCASGKMGLCIKCPDCMSTPTKFKVGDRVRHKGAPRIRGPVTRLWGDSIIQLFDDVGKVRLSYDAHELELIEPAKSGKMDGTSDLDLPQRDQHDELVLAMSDLLEEWGATFDKKQRAYGPKAIANAPLGAAEGLLNRIHDKYSRLVQLMQNPDVDDLGEATADTVKDMGIYCAMLVLVNEGKWPGV